MTSGALSSSCCFISLDESPTYSFSPGDVLELQPENPPEEVDKFIKLMKWSEPDALLHIESTSSGAASYELQPSADESLECRHR